MQAKLLALSVPYKWITGMWVPVLLVFVGVVGKKLARGSGGFRRQDFYLGPELTLAAVSAALLNIFDLLKPSRAVPVSQGAILSNVIASFLGLVLFMFVLSIHQDWESNGELIASGKPGKPVRTEMWWLLGFCNSIGVGLLVAGIILIPEG